jgi:hypothetical protein
MALGNEKISISENIVKVVGAKEFKVRRVTNCKLFTPCNQWAKKIRTVFGADPTSSFSLYKYRSVV